MRRRHPPLRRATPAKVLGLAMPPPILERRQDGHQRLFMEYDTDRAGGFEPLRFLPKNEQIVLGVMTSKSGALESKEQLKCRDRYFIDICEKSWNRLWAWTKPETLFDIARELTSTRGHGRGSRLIDNIPSAINPARSFSSPCERHLVGSDCHLQW